MSRSEARKRIGKRSVDSFMRGVGRLGRLVSYGPVKPKGLSETQGYLAGVRAAGLTKTKKSKTNRLVIRATQRAFSTKKLIKKSKEK